MSFEFPELPYAYDALEPYVDAQTMEIHYERHHRTYYDKFLGAVEGSPAASKDLAAIMAEVSGHGAAIRNNGGGLWNHTFFWQCMAPNAGGSPDGKLGDAISKAFGSFDAFKEQFTNAGITRFGSGFAWLVVDNDGKLVVSSTPNQDNPLMDVAEVKGTPILGLDVWEHAYYLKYQNKRPAYIDAWWNTVDWGFVGDNFNAAHS